MDITKIKEIEGAVGSPFYLLNIEQYKENLTLFKKAFLKRYSNLIVGYSFKTNYLPTLCCTAKDLGVYAEVVSRFEYDLALHLGFKGNSIIFNGPIKRTQDIYFALDNHSIINIDSYQELESVISYRAENLFSEIEIGLRINIDLKDEKGESHVQSGLREGRFGFAQDGLSKVIKRLRDNNITVVSLHGHTSSSDRAIANYGIICNQLLLLVKRFKLNQIKYFNVGGGFFGAAAKGIDVANKPSYEDYANYICSILLGDEWFKKVQPFIVIEPGVSVVANTLSFISKIYEIKKINDKKFIVIDGSVYDIKPTMHSNNLPHQFITSNECIVSDGFDADVVGSTCMEKDVILKNIKANCVVGDYIKFDGIGAYTIVMTPTFINTFSPILIQTKKGFQVVRRRQTLQDFLSVYNIEE